MTRTYREGIDIDVAFASQIKRAEAALGIRPLLGTAPRAQHAATSVNAPAAAAPRHSVAQTIFHRAARLAFRAAKPFLRPVAARIRRYVTAPLLEEWQTTQAAVRELQNGQAILRQEMRRNHAALLQEAQIANDRLGEIIAQETIRLRTEISGRRLVVTGPDAMLVRTAVGYVLCDPADHAALAALLETGEMEHGTRLVIESLLQPGDRFVDVGANLGLHTLAAGRALDGRGHVLAIEPFEPTAGRLERTIWINGLSDLVEVCRAAAYSQPGRLPLFLGATSGHHSLLPVERPSGPATAPVDVPLVTLDDLIGEARDVALVKIDVEGAELEVLHGARRVVRSNPGIGVIVEFAPSHVARAGRSIDEWFGAFHALDLVHREIDPATGELRSSSIDDLRHVKTANLLFGRPEAALWRRAAARS
jgi:FkbM family methyltransferase